MKLRGNKGGEMCNLKLPLVLLAMIVMMLPGGAKAAEWWWISDNENAIMFVDKSSIHELELNNRRLISGWIQIQNRNNDHLVDKKYYKYSMGMNYSDCNSKELTTKSSVFYEQNGSVVSSSTTNDILLKFEPVIPDTFGEAQLKFICGDNAREYASKRSYIVEDGRLYLQVDDPSESAKRSFTRTAPKPVTRAKKAPVKK